MDSESLGILVSLLLSSTRLYTEDKNESIRHIGKILVSETSLEETTQTQITMNIMKYERDMVESWPHTHLYHNDRWILMTMSFERTKYGSQTKCNRKFINVRVVQEAE